MIDSFKIDSFSINRVQFFEKIHFVFNGVEKLA